MSVSITTAFASSDNDKVLFIVENNEEKTVLEADCEKYEFKDDFFDVIVMTNVDQIITESYSAIALPYEVINEINFDWALEDKRTYLYGDLTISDYKKIMKLEEFSVALNIEDTKSGIQHKQGSI